jgi:hypothetical protein
LARVCIDRSVHSDKGKQFRCRESLVVFMKAEHGLNLDSSKEKKRRKKKGKQEVC